MGAEAWGTSNDPQKTRLTKDVCLRLAPAPLLRAQRGLELQHCCQRGFGCLPHPAPQRFHSGRLTQPACCQSSVQALHQGDLVPQGLLRTAHAAHHLGANKGGYSLSPLLLNLGAGAPESREG